jgi:tetratricopeptide (TPR) repeat protein
VAQQLSEAEIDERSNKIISETEVLLKYGLKARACEHLRRVFDLDPYNIDAREKLKDLLLELGSVDEALDQLFLLADVFKESQPEGSVYYLHEILKIDPSNRLARQLLSDVGGVMPEELREEEPATTSPEESTYVGPQKRERKEDSGVAELELDDIDESIPGMNETTAPERHRQDEGIDLSLQDLTLQDEFFETPLTGLTGEFDIENVHLSDFAEIGVEDAVVDSTAREGDIPDLSGEVMVADEDEGEYFDEEEVMIEDDVDEDVPVVSSERLPVPLDDGPATREYNELYVMGHALENGEQAQERHPHYSEPPTGRHSMAEILAAEAVRVREGKGSAPVRIPDSSPVDLAAIDSWHMPPEERADPSVAAKTAPPPADLSAEAAEVEFFLDQSLFDEAVQIIDDLERSYPGHPTLAALRGRLPASAALALPLEQTDSERSSLIAEGLFDAADFSDSLAEDPVELGRTSLAENLSGQFRVEVKEQVDDTDFATHFDLGMAYKEMRLSDEAIKEFKIASGDPERAGQAQIMIGLCHASAGDLDRAVKIFEEGLNSNGLPISDRLGLLYELGKLHEERSQVDLALTCYENIVAEDPAFADVVERINRLQ